MLPTVLKETDIANEQSLNTIVGHKTDFFIDLKNGIINSPEQYVLLWMQGFKNNWRSVCARMRLGRPTRGRVSVHG